MLKKYLKVSAILLCFAFLMLVFISGNPISVNAWKTAATPVCNADEDQINAKITKTSDGGIIIAWADNRDLDWNIYAQKLDAYGSPLWALNGVPVCTVSGVQSWCEPVADGEGGAIMIWHDYRSGFSDIYAQRLNSTGHRQWILDGVPICNADDSQMNFRACSDEEGGALIAWQDNREGLGDPDIYAQRITPTGINLWGNNGTVVCNATGRQNFPSIIPDLSGGAHVSWTDRRSGSTNDDRDIYAQRLNSTDGSQLWTNNGIPICTASMEQGYTQMIGDIFGNAIISWVDARTDSLYDIYIQKVNKSGITKWDNNGLAVCTISGVQSTHALCSDKSDGAIIAWEDQRDGHSDIYAQRINVAGGIAWTPNGTAVCTSDGEQVGITIVEDGDFGAILSWQDWSDPSETPLYMQRIQSDGSSLWGDNGTIVDYVPNAEQIIQDMVLLNPGVAIITWEDDRNSGEKDIWAQYMLDTEAPLCNSPADRSYQQGTVNATIPWILTDNAGGGHYRVLKDSIIYISWTEWEIGESLNIAVDTSATGEFSYVIQYNDSQGRGGVHNEVMVMITAPSPPPLDIWPFVIIGVIVGAAVIGVVLFLVLRKRKSK